MIKLYAKNVQSFPDKSILTSLPGISPTDDIHFVNIHGSPSLGNIVTYGKNTGKSKNFVNHFEV